MHEISLVRNIFRTLEEEFPNDMDRVRKIHLKVGLLSNVQKTSLYVEVLPILIHCDECDKTSQVQQYRFVCACGKPSRNVVQGEELLISNVEMDD
jgi:hydrogenase nickel incorporation protein HypA/HybF